MLPKSEAHRKKLSEAAAGKIVSKKTREKISKARMGIKLSEETRKRMSEAAKNRRVKWVKEARSQE